MFQEGVVTQNVQLACQMLNTPAQNSGLCPASVLTPIAPMGM